MVIVITRRYDIRVQTVIIFRIRVVAIVVIIVTMRRYGPGDIKVQKAIIFRIRVLAISGNSDNEAVRSRGY